MTEKTLITLVALLCCVVIVVTALLCGYDSSLALYAILLLFGGKEILERILKNK